MTQSALRDFTRRLRPTVQRSGHPQMDKAIADYYHSSSPKRPRSPAEPASTSLRAVADVQRRALPAGQLHRETAQQRPGHRDERRRTAARGRPANATYQDFFREIVTRFAFEDALILDGRGNVVYSAYKNTDLGTNILTGPYSSSKLRDAYREAMSSNKADGWCSPTSSSMNRPTWPPPPGWSRPSRPPVRRKAFWPCSSRSPRSTRSSPLTKWAEVGMGETGETILAGSDFLMRSDSRLFLEDPDKVPTESHRRRHPTRHPGHRDPARAAPRWFSRVNPGFTAKLARRVIPERSSPRTISAGRPSRPTSRRANRRPPLVVGRQDRHEGAFARGGHLHPHRGTGNHRDHFSSSVCSPSSLAQVFLAHPAAGGRRSTGCRGDYQVDVPVETRGGDR